MSLQQSHLRLASVRAEMPMVRVQGDTVVSFGPHLHQEHTPDEALRYGRALIEAAEDIRRARNHAPERAATRCSFCSSDESSAQVVRRVEGRPVGFVLACPKCGVRGG